MKTTKNIPELRFPGFEGEWKKKTFGEISTKIGSGSTPKGGEEVYQTVGIPFIRSQNIVDNQLVLDDTCIPNEVHAKMSGSKVFPNDVLLNITGASIGRSCVVPDNFKEGNVNQHVSIIRLKKYSPNFVQLIIASQRGQKLIYEGQTGSGREGLNFESIKRFKMSFPSIPEQQKIASFLSSVDQRIQLLTRKKEQLEQYKKGVMQQIFSRQLRFKDEQGKEFPNWEETQFGSLYRFLSTNSLSREKLNYEFGTIKNIHYGDIHTKFKSHFIIDNELVPYIKPEIDLSKINADNFLKEGDLIIADASEDYADIGKSIEIYQLNNQAVLAGLHTILARRKHQKVLIGFGGHMMKSFEVRNQIQRIAQGTKVLSISANRLSELKILLPSKPEQQKIASFLSSIDDKITHVNTQIEQTRKWKQGLLQKMFV